MPDRCSSSAPGRRDWPSATSSPAQGRDFAILDAAAEPAAAWRSRWDSLSLFTPARFDGLPGLPFPGDPDHYPGRDEVVDYLTGYAERLALPVRLSSRVTLGAGRAGRRLRRHGGRATCSTPTRWSIATGPFQVPRVPVDLAERLDPAIEQLHSADYRRPRRSPPSGPGGRRRQHRLPDRRGARGRRPRGAPGDRHAARRRCPSACSGATRSSSSTASAR